MSESEWNQLAKTYEYFSQRADSLDRLQDWPAQRDAVGDVSGLSILDIGCGSGRKAFYFATHGAEEVVGVDISSDFIEAWASRRKPSNLSFHQGDISALQEIEALSHCQFDVVVCFQALSYADNIDDTLTTIRSMLVPGGRFVLSTAHPFRFAIEKNETTGQAFGAAYRDESNYTYPSSWDSSVMVTHQKPMISTLINSLIRAGFRLQALYEPDMVSGERSLYPHKAEWVDQYLGLIVYDCRLA